MWETLSDAERQLLSETLFPKGISAGGGTKKIMLPKPLRGVAALVINSNKSEPVSEEHMAYVNKILSTPAFNLSPADYLIIDATAYSKPDMLTFIQQYAIKTALCFNVHPLAFNIKDVQAYTPVVRDGITYVFTHPLEKFEKDKDHRHAMFMTLKYLFAK